MEEMLTLLNWLILGGADYVQICIGSRQNTQKGMVSLIESGTLVERTIITRMKEKIINYAGKYHQVFFFFPSKTTIIPFFRRYRKRFQKFVGNPILIKEKFADSKCQMKTKNMQEESINIKNNPIKHSRSCESVVICKIHPFVLKPFISSLTSSKIYKSDIKNALKSTILFNKFKNARLHFSFFELARKHFSYSKIIGQFNAQFIILALKKSFFIIDQHALHERIMLEKLLSKYKRTIDIEKAKERACKNAIKFNEKLTRAKMYEIVNWISGLNQPFICCHGRPSIIHLYTQNRRSLSKKKDRSDENISKNGYEISFKQKKIN